MTLLESRFDIFITVDRNLAFQNPTRKFKIGIIVLAAPTNRMVDLKKLVPSIKKILGKMKPGMLEEIFE